MSIPTFKTFVSEGRSFAVPEFKTEKEMNSFLHKLPGAGKVKANVMNPETGEIILAKGEMKKKIMKVKADSNRLRAFGDFDEVYIIKYAMLSKIVGEELVDIEDTKVPEFVQRKDGFTLDEYDLDDIQYQVEEEEELPNGISPTSFDKKGKRVYIDYEIS